jgi:hypothetical protein
VPKELMDAVPDENLAGWDMSREGTNEDERGVYTIVRVELTEDDRKKRGYDPPIPGAQRKVAALLHSVGKPVEDAVAQSWLARPCEDRE